MVRIFSLIVPSLFLIAVSCMVVSCSPASGRSSGLGRTHTGATQAVQPLSTHSSRAESLASINSLEISPPVIARSVRGFSMGREGARRIVEQVARETMTLRLWPDSGAGRAAGKADAILSTEILRFDERQGSAIGGEPAVVSFRMSMRLTPSGEEIWTAQYFLRQEAVSENLLRIKERVGKDGLGAGWRTAEDVFRRGVGAALQDFNNQREGQFLVGAAK